MEWEEVTPLPNECQNCQEEECYNCDTAGKQWQLSEVDELRVRRKGLEKAVERLQRQIAAIDERLAEIEDEPNVLMTQEIWEHCVWVCYQDGDVLQLRKLLAEHPEYVHEWNKQYEDELNSPGSKLKQKEEDYWARLKPKLIEEFGEACSLFFSYVTSMIFFRTYIFPKMFSNLGTFPKTCSFLGISPKT